MEHETSARASSNVSNRIQLKPYTDECFGFPWAIEPKKKMKCQTARGVNVISHQIIFKFKSKLDAATRKLNSNYFSGKRFLVSYLLKNRHVVNGKKLLEKILYLDNSLSFFYYWKNTKKKSCFKILRKLKFRGKTSGIFRSF